MGAIEIVGAVLVGFSAGVFVGSRLGIVVRGRSSRYWMHNIAVFALCMALDFVGLLLGWAWLAYGSLGLMAGAITGLRYGYADTLGKMRRVDPADTAQAAGQPEDGEPGESDGDGPRDDEPAAG